MPVDLHKLNIGSSVWYTGIECAVTMLRKNTDPNIDYPDIKTVWTISLVDMFSYKEEFSGKTDITLDPNRTYVFTGEVIWETLEKDCAVSNAIDFIREPA